MPWQDASASGPVVAVASIRGRSTFAVPDAERLERLADVRYLQRQGSMSRADALAAFAGARVVAVTPKVSPVWDADLLAGLPQLRGIALYATGYDFVDVPLLERHGVQLSVLPDYSTTSVAEHTMGLLLTMSRRIHLGNDRSRGLVDPGTSLRGFELDGKVLGVIGCGRIGSRVAGYAQAFGMSVVSYDVDPKPVAGVRYVERDELLAVSDVVTLHCPMVHGDPALLGSGELARMRPGALLVNCSRAALVDPDAVVTAVRAGRLRGYALDDETLSGRTDVADLVAEGRVVQTGHSAWWSDEVLERGGRMWAEHIEALLAGCALDPVADPAVAPATGTDAGVRSAVVPAAAR